MIMNHGQHDLEDKNTWSILENQKAVLELRILLLISVPGLQACAIMPGQLCCVFAMFMVLMKLIDGEST